jgi:hypothetical protein
MKSTKVEDLIKEGFTVKFANRYINAITAEKQESCFDQDYADWAHAHGFYAESACSYKLNDSNVDSYLSDYDYYKIWPLNGWTRIWVNDKLTLKMMLAGSEYGDIMPKYYYYSTPSGLKALVDNPYQGGKVEEFLQLLAEVNEYACKPCNGTTAIGFVKMAYENGNYLINEKEVSKEEVAEFIASHPNYVFTEYIHPSEQFSKYSNQIHTMRIVTLNDKGANPQIVGGYLRLPNKNNGEANYTVLNGTDVNKFNLFVELDAQNGVFGNAMKTFCNRVEGVERHPDTNEIIAGTIPNYDNLKQTILGIAQRFNTLEWLGFDIGVTNNGFKCMEINTHPGIKYMQIFRSLYADDITREYFMRKVHEIDALSEDAKLNRNKITR